jgi:hypothetical protein
MTTPGHHSSAAPDKHDRTQPIERVVFFPDAVAIAMTLAPRTAGRGRPADAHGQAVTSP